MPIDEMTGLTDMERLSKVYGERGYLVVVGFQEWKLGEIIPDVGLFYMPTGIPCRITAETDFADFKEQFRMGWPGRSMRRYVPYPQDCFFYRVETD